MTPTTNQPFSDETDAQGTPTNLGGSLQLAVEGAQRWWRNFGRQELETILDFQIPSGHSLEMAAIMGFLCGRLELDTKQHWSRIQAAINTGKAKGHILVPGRDPTTGLT